MGNAKFMTSGQSNQFLSRDGHSPGKASSLSLIIPTKNRPHELTLVVQSLFEQTVGAAELIIVDQSPDEVGKLAVERQFEEASAAGHPVMDLRYIHEPSIGGGAAARNHAMNIARGDIWLFLDDDVYLEPDFLEQILAAYEGCPDAAGVSGIITNYVVPSPGFRFWSSLFERGPFRDERQPIYWHADRLRNSAPIRVRKFGGGLMSFRASAIQDLRFDENLRGVCDGEDVDLCMQLERRSGSRLLIAPAARLVHNQSPSGRLQDHWVRRQARASLFLFNKHWNRGLKNKLCFSWLLTGYGMVVSFASLRRGSLDPWRAFLAGMREGRVG